MNTSFSAAESLNQLNSFNKALEINSSIRDDISQIEQIYEVVAENGIEIPATFHSIKNYLGKGKKYLAYGNDLISLYQKTQEKEPSMADFLESVSTLINFAPSGKGMVGKLLTPLKSSIQDTLKMAADASIVGPFFIHMYLSQDENYINKYIDIKKDGSTSADSMALVADSEWKQFSGRKTMRSIVQMTVDVLEGGGFPTYLNHQDTEQLIYCVSLINAAEKFDSKAVREQFIRHLAQIIEREKENESGPGNGKYRLEVMCPVDVYIYQNGNCIGSIVNGEIDNRANDTIRMDVYGENLDKKVIEFVDFDDFHIELEATDVGTMELLVRQYDASGVHLKTAGFQEVPLNNGKRMQLDLELNDIFPDYLELQMQAGEKEMIPTLFLTGEEVSEQPERIELLDDRIVMECGDSYRIPRIIQPLISDERYVEWKSSDASCVAVDSVGNIMAKTSGMAMISASVNGRELASVQVNVTMPVESIEILCAGDSLFVGQQIALGVRALPEDTELECEWMSENPNILSVDSQGNITALAEGTTIVKAYSQIYSHMAVMELTVKEKEEHPGDTTDIPFETPDKPGYPGNGGSSHGGGGSGGSGHKMGEILNIPYIYSGAWEQSEEKWRFILDNGSYARMSWVYDKGKWYIIGQDGYMLVGWQFIGRDWYYFNPDGSMATGWLVYNNQKYYLNPLSNGSQGKMLIGWQLLAGKWYYFKTKSDGTKGMLLTDIWIDNYYVNQDGVWEEGKLHK